MLVTILTAVVGAIIGILLGYRSGKKSFEEKAKKAMEEIKNIKIDNIDSNKDN